ncbi:Redox-sensitive transcriptional activator SoxR [Methylobacterium tardum]|uniref:Redox-sensitive transcriptional activator SoxR n=1 Tax=Methylobacterium tardum TaxID=374432 RepID=A0AA37TNW6_9HYPH|nr:redox-sensitive transcriptional activator SoxR [Methylobacterium tardum]URD38588.1 redox-sensitive transcriptional activator SoxR [Methylobacterium tardum]GJE49203.1 Redox-sensitive transcriptional activator SoxR [Methylobacterium tardum]GLS74453.1 redox-sensitive transcriptional activator SoxR [Methylobacterium tardum]
MSASAVRRTALPEFLTVGEVARRSGVAVSTVHFYEAKGLIAATRSGGNQRRFSRDVLRRVAIIRVAQGFGVSLAEIADLLKPIPPGKRPTAAQIRAMVGGWRAMLQARIDGLALLRDRLDGCIGCGCLSQTECPLRNPLDRLGSEGRGPVLLQRTSRL